MSGWARFITRGAKPLALLLLTGCALRPEPPSTEPDPMGVVRIEPNEIRPESDEAPTPVDPTVMDRHLARRFPGVNAVDFARFVVVPMPPSGPCHTKISPPWETAFDLTYVIDGSEWSGVKVAELKAQGWWPTYRTPRGFGIERRASFESIDLALRATATCICEGRPPDPAGDAAIELRVRWRKGEMPQPSASLTRRGVRQVVPPSVGYGHLLTYNFETTTPFAGGAPGACGAQVEASILADPPML